MLDLNDLYNMDCMEGLAQYPDGYFELAIVDPPYGIDKAFTPSSRIAKYGQTQTANDDKPSPEYFRLLFRKTKNQIIWGYNHLSDMLPAAKEFVFWYKHQPVDNYAHGELAWTSFDKSAKCFDYPYFGGHGQEKDEKRIHPMQKPIALYQWLLNQYAKPGDVILDTHVGSASSLVACHQLGFDFVGFEKDPTYYQSGLERLEAHRSQLCWT